MTAGVPALQTFGLAKRFRRPEGDPFEALECVDLTAKAGTLTVVEGWPGSGRTTLLRCLARRDQPERGRAYLSSDLMVVELAGADHRTLSWVRRHHLRHFEGEATMPARTTAGAWTARQLQRAGVNRAVAARRAATTLARFGLADHAPVSQLTPPERRLLTLVGTLLPPGVAVLLDEPLAAVDPEHHDALLSLVAETCQRGAAVVATAAPGSALARAADVVLLLHQGRVS